MLVCYASGLALPLCITLFLRAMYVSKGLSVHVSFIIIQSYPSSTGIIALSSMYVLNIMIYLLVVIVIFYDLSQ